MRPGRTLRRLERLEAALGRPREGMYPIPASELYQGDREYEPRLIRLIRHLANKQFYERFLKWKFGDMYVPTWELSREDRIKVWALLREVGRRAAQWRREHPEHQLQIAKETKERLESRREVERDKGRPVAFLYPCDAERLQDCSKPRPRPVADPEIDFAYLTPVYADDTVGDPLLYSVHDPF